MRSGSFAKLEIPVLPSLPEDGLDGTAASVWSILLIRSPLPAHAPSVVIAASLGHAVCGGNDVGGILAVDASPTTAVTTEEAPPSLTAALAAT